MSDDATGPDFLRVHGELVRFGMASPKQTTVGELMHFLSQMPQQLAVEIVYDGATTWGPVARFYFDQENRRIVLETS